MSCKIHVAEKEIVEIETCLKCGRRYEVKKIKIMFRDKDSFDCICGQELKRWNGSTMFDFTLIDPTGTSIDSQ